MGYSTPSAVPAEPNLDGSAGSNPTKRVDPTTPLGQAGKKARPRVRFVPKGDK
jgi:hypothetical protein